MPSRQIFHSESRTRLPFSQIAPFLTFAQNRCGLEFLARLKTEHRLMHCIRAEVNAAGPLHASEIGIDGNGVEDAGVQQL